MRAVGWVVILIGLVFGVAGGAANVVLAQNYSEFWWVSVPLAVVGLGSGWYLLQHGGESGTMRREDRTFL